MKRRHFLASAAALPIVASLPSIPAPVQATIPQVEFSGNTMVFSFYAKTKGQDKWRYYEKEIVDGVAEFPINDWTAILDEARKVIDEMPGRPI